MNKIKILIIVAVSVGGYLLGEHVGGKAAEAEKIIHLKEIAKLKERMKKVTVVIEKPDGSKETKIIEERNTFKETNRDHKQVEKVSFKPQWGVYGSGSVTRSERVYTLGVDRRILGGLFVGIYGRSDSEFGLNLRYEF